MDPLRSQMALAAFDWIRNGPVVAVSNHNLHVIKCKIGTHFDTNRQARRRPQ